MTTTAPATTHTARCFDLAVAMVQEELDLQGLDWDVNADQTDLDIPAWGTTVNAIAIDWLSSGTASCHCRDFA